VAPEAFYAVLDQALAKGDGPCRGQVFQGGAILRVRGGEQRVWSPALHLHVEGDAAGPWVLHGRFSPSSPVWTAFVAIYLSLACIGLGAACYGGAQMTMDQTPWAFVGAPIAAALAAFTHGAAYVGQGLGADDMYELRAFVERIADRPAA
jgi:hypothetical protein